MVRILVACAFVLSSFLVPATTDPVVPDGIAPAPPTDTRSDAPPQRNSRCYTNNDCDSDQFCQTPSGDCDARGKCQLRPSPCTNMVAPVCGCDGVTYLNPCMANAAGVAVFVYAPCG